MNIATVFLNEIHVGRGTSMTKLLTSKNCWISFIEHSTYVCTEILMYATLDTQAFEMKLSLPTF